MGITLKTPKSAIDAYFRQCADIITQNILTALTKLGEECVSRIRDRSAEESWIDHTGNLRSSIGYAVYDHAKEFFSSDFPIVLQGARGASLGRQMLTELAQKYSDTYALVVVAGMEYAEYVEAIESKDVLESTRIWAENAVESRIKTAIDVAVARINKLSI